MRHLTAIFLFDCFTANLPCKPLSAILRLFRGICGSFCIIAQRTVYRAFKRLYSMACHAAAVDSKKIRMCIFWHISNNDFCYNLAAFRLSYTPIDVIISLVQSTRSRMQVSFYALYPSERGCCPMNTMEVLTLLLVIFTALSYIDQHKKK